MTKAILETRRVDDDPNIGQADPSAGLDLYWIPLGAGARVVRVSGRIYETIASFAARRPRRHLYHSALVATDSSGRVMIEMAPIPDDRGRADRGVVAEGAVGSRWLSRLRMFRYENRRWRNGKIPDLAYAVASPVHLTDDPHVISAVLDFVSLVPTPVWGRDELHLGEMWNSNSVVSWLLARVELLDAAGQPPGEGRAPGWDAGVAAAAQKDTPSMGDVPMSTTATRTPKHPPPWFVHTAWRVHRALYRLSGGRFVWTTSNKRGWGALRLTTTGRKSGQERSVIIGYLEDGPDLVALAMNGWDEGHPAWWLNLEAHPDAVIRLPHQQPGLVHARPSAGAERERLWERWVAADPRLDAYAGQRTTETPVIVLELGTRAACT